MLENGQGGTGFLIGKDLIMTNNHVITDIEAAKKAKAVFFYTTGNTGIEVNLDPDSFFCTSPTPDQLGFKPITATHLDFTIVSLASHPKIAEIAHLSFCIFEFQKPEKLGHANIIHHPFEPDGTTYQKVSFRDNIIQEVSLHTLHYTTSTMPGSSGSPVMDDQGNLLALHRATCTHILGGLLKQLSPLLKEIFPNCTFTHKEFHSTSKTYPAQCAIIDGSPLYIFSEGELKGQYFHQGKMRSPASLLKLLPKPAKEWALQFLQRQGVVVEDYHKECNTAVPLKPICTYLQRTGHLDFIKARYEACQKTIHTLLKETYLKNLSSLPLILTNEEFPITDFFTQLSIVSQASQEKKEEEVRRRDPHLIEKDSLREVYARLHAPEESIELKTLFDKGKKVLLLGRAGIGKSTLCQKIAYDWAAGVLFVDKFIAVYHLKLRELNHWILSNPLRDLQDPNEWLSYAIAELCYQGAHQKIILQELQKHAEKTLFLFDGWDEASSLLTKALSRCLRQIQASHYLLTSRPGVTGEIQNNFDLTVENMGFTQEQIKIYAEKFFTHTQTPDLPLFLQALRSRSNLFTLCQIPIQLQILCSLWHNGAQTFPQNLTSMFSKITEYLFLWEQRKQSETHFKGKNKTSLRSSWKNCFARTRDKATHHPQKTD